MKEEVEIASGLERWKNDGGKVANLLEVTSRPSGYQRQPDMMSWPVDLQFEKRLSWWGDRKEKRVVTVCCQGFSGSVRRR